MNMKQQQPHTPQDQAAESLFQGIFAQADRKLAKKLRSKDKMKRAAQADGRADRRVRHALRGSKERMGS